MAFPPPIAAILRHARGAACALGVVATMAGPAAVAAEEKLAPESAPHLELRTPLDASVPLRALTPVDLVVVAQPEIAKVAAVGPQALYVQGRELGSTNLLVFDRDGHLTQTIAIRVGHDADGLRETLAAALPEEPIEVTALSTGLMISGEVSSPSALQIAEGLAERTAPGAVISRLRARSSQVRLDVRIVEASSRRLRDLGATLSATDGTHVAGSIGGALVGPELPQTTATAQFNAGRYAVDAALRALESKGDARIIARPTLIALNGAKASFRSGGELPYPIPQDDGQITVEFRPYGAALSFTPEVQANGLIRVALDAELSAVDASAGLTIADTSVPGLSTRRAATAVELRDGQPFVIAGLFEDANERVAQRTPGLSRIPLIGAVFQSQREKDTRRELAIIVTPTIATPVETPPPAEVAKAEPVPAPAAVAPPRPGPKVGADPRGPPLVALVREVRDVVRPPLRWVKRQVTAFVSALVAPRRTQYASNTRE